MELEEKLERINTLAIQLSNYMAGFFSELPEEEYNSKLAEFLRLLTECKLENIITYIAWYGPHFRKINEDKH